jgi:hypothetical protein
MTREATLKRRYAKEQRFSRLVCWENVGVQMIGLDDVAVSTGKSACATKQKGGDFSPPKNWTRLPNTTMVTLQYDLSI